MADDFTPFGHQTRDPAAGGGRFMKKSTRNALNAEHAAATWGQSPEQKRLTADAMLLEREDASVRAYVAPVLTAIQETQTTPTFASWRNLLAVLAQTRQLVSADTSFEQKIQARTLTWLTNLEQYVRGQMSFKTRVANTLKQVVRRRATDAAAWAANSNSFWLRLGGRALQARQQRQDATGKSLANVRAQLFGVAAERDAQVGASGVSTRDSDGAFSPSRVSPDSTPGTADRGILTRILTVDRGILKETQGINKNLIDAREQTDEQFEAADKAKERADDTPRTSLVGRISERVKKSTTDGAGASGILGNVASWLTTSAIVKALRGPAVLSALASAGGTLAVVAIAKLGDWLKSRGSDIAFNNGRDLGDSRRSVSDRIVSGGKTFAGMLAASFGGPMGTFASIQDAATGVVMGHVAGSTPSPSPIPSPSIPPPITSPAPIVPPLSSSPIRNTSGLMGINPIPPPQPSPRRLVASSGYDDVKRELTAQGITNPDAIMNVLGNVARESHGAPGRTEVDYMHTPWERFVEAAPGPASRTTKDEYQRIQRSGDKSAMWALMYGSKNANYYGRGLIQLTGVDNYAAVTRQLRKDYPELGNIDLVKNPEYVTDPRYAAKIVVSYLRMKTGGTLNETKLANADYTNRIITGTTDAHRRAEQLQIASSWADQHRSQFGYAPALTTGNIAPARSGPTVAQATTSAGQLAGGQARPVMVAVNNTTVDRGGSTPTILPIVADNRLIRGVTGAGASIF